LCLCYAADIHLLHETGKKIFFQLFGSCLFHVVLCKT
jgi:hypothetical protein